MIRFLADANFNHSIVKVCRRQEPSLDFLSANEAKLEELSDPEVLARAAEQNRILVTHDRRMLEAVHTTRRIVVADGRVTEA